MFLRMKMQSLRQHIDFICKASSLIGEVVSSVLRASSTRFARVHVPQMRGWKFGRRIEKLNGRIWGRLGDGDRMDVNPSTLPTVAGQASTLQRAKRRSQRRWNKVAPWRWNRRLHTRLKIRVVKFLTNLLFPSS